MPITQLHVSGYRSIRRLTVPLKQINVLVGANGSGKSNLYRALFLVAAAANGSLARTIAEEGGLPSALWAGRRTKTEEAKIRIAVEIDEDTEYVLKFGRVAISQRPGLLGNFSNDLDIKQEQLITVNHRGKRTALVQRKGGMTTLLDVDGRTVTYPSSVAANESILTALREPHRFPELAQLRERFLACRFYHHFRLDAESPLRQPQVGILTPVMSHDGTDVACALATIMAMDGPATVHEAFEAAFPGARLIVNSECGEFDLQVKMPGVCRPFQAIELSDGTLQYACLLACCAIKPSTSRLTGYQRTGD